MFNCNQRRLHVAVQLSAGFKEADAAETNKDDHIETPPASPAIDSSSNAAPLTLYQSLHVIDFQTLHIKMKHGASTKQRFDHVSYTADDALNSQVCQLLDELVLKRQNCCMLFFDAQHDGTNLIFLFKLLITEFNMRLEQLDASICRINLMYMKSDDNTEQQQSDQEEIAVASSSRGVRVCHFESTLELLRWLLNVYRLARTADTEYETLEINFLIRKGNAFADADEIFDVKLSLFNMYFTKLDERSRSQLVAYVTPTEQRQEVFQHTLMTALLRDYIEEDPEDRKLLLCNIPIEMQGSTADAFLLTIAIKLFEKHSKDGKYNRKRSLLSSVEGANAMTLYVETPPNSMAALKQRSICFSIPFKENSSKKSRSCQRSYSNEYLNKLRTWYTKLDEGFDEAEKLMEIYYASKYETISRHMSPICRDIKQLSQNIDILSPSTPTEEPKQESADMECATKEHLHNLQKDYQNKLQQLNSGVETSVYADDLKAYLCTKQFAHAQQTLVFKIKQLEACKQRLNRIFDEEIVALSCSMYGEEI